MEQNKLKKEPLGNSFFINVSENHKFGTDAVLLADFCNATARDKHIDLGTGCGIIPFLLLRDGKTIESIGVEISEEACALATKTKEELKLDKFTIINSDLNDLKGKIEFGCHTLITCNPPYKAPGAGLQNPNERHRVARHEVMCTLEDIIRVSGKLLQTSGRLCMCHRPERLAELISLLREYKLEPKRLRTVHQRQAEEPWLILIEAKKCAKIGLRIDPPLYVEENGDFTAEMKEIYGSYKEAYLNAR